MKKTVFYGLLAIMLVICITTCSNSSGGKNEPEPDYTEFEDMLDNLSPANPSADELDKVGMVQETFTAIKDAINGFKGIMQEEGVLEMIWSDPNNTGIANLLSEINSLDNATSYFDGMPGGSTSQVMGNRQVFLPITPPVTPPNLSNLDKPDTIDFGTYGPTGVEYMYISWIVKDGKWNPAEILYVWIMGYIDNPNIPGINIEQLIKDQIKDELEIVEGFGLPDIPPCPDGTVFAFFMESNG